MSSIQRDGKPVSVFDNSEFCNGFLQFATSEQYEKYMVPFLNELIETHRDKLESVKDCADWQSRLKAIRFVKDAPEMIRMSKQQLASGE